MNKLILLLSILAISISTVNAQEKLPIDISKSTIKWSCDYSFYFNGHYGIVTFQKGHFTKTNGKITGGTFTIDLNTITTQDMEEEGNKNLTAHLKDPDFFDVKKFPTATLEMKNVSYLETNKIRVEADLTIKGITKDVKFDATLNFDTKTMKTRFKIDRTRWGINYNSAVKDSAISDAIGFEVTIGI
ncbi:YceI family protein [Kordia algicida OT-1]|uniref:YCE I like family protein n=1 Tax=Kordia algicida OT-1 TaxID=391587 RepID=A9DRA8_9FLAO|nr:YceI family protein [Kordia algicida]EDP96766.1 YCE I like family protein [Kordia algicida OT-1]